MKQSQLRVLYCISFEKFCEILKVPDNDYAVDKFRLYKLDLSRFLMELDIGSFERFISWSEYEDNRQKSKVNN